MNYEAGRFSDLSLGKDLWQVLNREDNIIRMETATELNRTAAESVSKTLLDEFGDDVKVNRVKQMIGHMIRQIMESRGYQMGTQNVSDFSLKLQGMLMVQRKLLKSATLTEITKKIMATDTDLEMTTNNCHIS